MFTNRKDTSETASQAKKRNARLMSGIEFRRIDERSGRGKKKEAIIRQKMPPSGNHANFGAISAAFGAGAGVG